MRRFDGWFLGEEVKEISEKLWKIVRDKEESSVSININGVRIIMYKETGLLENNPKSKLVLNLIDELGAF